MRQTALFTGLREIPQTLTILCAGTDTLKDESDIQIPIIIITKKKIIKDSGKLGGTHYWLIKRLLLKAVNMCQSS